MLSLIENWPKNVIEKSLKKIKKVVDFSRLSVYNTVCVRARATGTGCGSAWLERLVWDQEAAGSNPVTPICIQFKKHLAGVVQW